MDGITLNRQMKNRLNKIMESGDIKLDRNLTARCRLAQKFAKRDASGSSSGSASASTSSSSSDAASASGSSSSASGMSTRSLWTDPDIRRTIETMDPEQRYKYSQIGQELFKTGGIIDKMTMPDVKDPQTAVFEAAAQIKLMLRDGLDPAELSEEEKVTLVAAIGPEEAESKYGITIPDEVLTIS